MSTPNLASLSELGKSATIEMMSEVLPQSRSGLLLRLATRGSALALWQAEMVRARLLAFDPALTVEIVVVKTTGDVRQDVPLSAVAGKGVFVREIETALLSGEAHIAVHSAKDLPSVDPPGLTLAAFCERADPRDALVYPSGTWDILPTGATVATGAPRRVAQLKYARPDLNFVGIRGNVDTRLAKLESGVADALVLACAGLDRLGRSSVITERLPITLSLPQVGQGCVAVQCRTADTGIASMVRAACDHAETREAVTAERAFLALLGGGCTAPVAAHSIVTGEYLHLTARVADAAGTRLLGAHSVVPRGSAPAALAEIVFRSLQDQGAESLLQTEVLPL